MEFPLTPASACTIRCISALGEERADAFDCLSLAYGPKDSPVDVLQCESFFAKNSG